MEIPANASRRSTRTTLLLVLVALGFCPEVEAQLHGSYTVGGTAPDYPTLDAAITSLDLIGCNAPVTFLLRPGDYSTDLAVYISGLTPYYPVLIKSETEQAEDVITTLSGVYECSDLTFQYLTIYPRVGGSSGWLYKGLEVTFSHRITFDHCIVQGLPADGFHNGISVAKGDSHTFTHNQFRDLENAMVYSSIELGGSGSNRHVGPNIIWNNSFDSCEVAIRIQGIIYGDSLDIGYNRITNSGIGVYLDGWEEEIYRTYVHHNTMYGLYDHGIETYRAIGYSALPVQIYNNMISGGYTRNVSMSNENGTFHTTAFEGVYLRESENVWVFDNSLFGAVALNEVNSIVLRNNILHSDTSVVLYTDYNTQGLTSDHNDIHRSDGGFAVIHSTWDWYTDLDTFRNATGLEASSVSVDPHFVDNANDLHAAHPLIQFGAVPMPLAVDDIDGDLRDAEYPDIGADEFNHADLPPIAWFAHDCPQDLTVQFEDLSVRPGTYFWDFDDGSPADTSADPAHSFPSTGDYQVMLIVSNDFGIDTITFQVSIPALEVPTFLGGVLSVSPDYTDYQWSLDGAAIVGADSNAFVPATDGSYAVTYTDSFGCIWTSATMSVYVGMLEQGIDGWALYPVPARDHLFLLSATPREGEEEVIVRDALGRTCLHRVSRAAFPMDISALSPGPYTLSISSQGMSARTFRFIIQDRP